MGWVCVVSWVELFKFTLTSSSFQIRTRRLIFCLPSLERTQLANGSLTFANSIQKLSTIYASSIQLNCPDRDPSFGLSHQQANLLHTLRPCWTYRLYFHQDLKKGLREKTEYSGRRCLHPCLYWLCLRS